LSESTSARDSCRSQAPPRHAIYSNLVRKGHVVVRLFDPPPFLTLLTPSSTLWTYILVYHPVHPQYRTYLSHQAYQVSHSVSRAKICQFHFLPSLPSRPFSCILPIPPINVNTIIVKKGIGIRTILCDWRANPCRECDRRHIARGHAAERHHNSWHNGRL
jgi:hypothetical protein